MEYVNLGRTGLKVSRLFFGGFAIGGPAIDRDQARRLVHTAWESGINTFYTSDSYNGGASEQILGDILKPRREDMVLIVKTGARVTTPEAPGSSDERWARQGVRGLVDYEALWSGGVSPTSFGLSWKYLMQAIEASLRRLGTDYIDVYVAHFWDPFTPIEETLETFDNLIRQGKVRYIGCSQTKAWQLYRSLWVSEVNHLARYESIQAWFSVIEPRAHEGSAPHGKRGRREFSRLCITRWREVGRIRQGFGDSERRDSHGADRTIARACARSRSRPQRTRPGLGSRTTRSRFTSHRTEQT